MSWTDERIATLTKMWEGGSTASQIAEQLGGFSRNAVIGKAHRLGLKSRPSPVQANEENDHKPVLKKPTASPDPVGEKGTRKVKPAASLAVAADAPASPPDEADAAKSHADDPQSDSPRTDGRVNSQPLPNPSSSAQRIVSVGPGGFLRQGPGEQQAPIPPAPPRRLVPAKPSAGITGKTSLLDLSERVCRWPMGHPGEPDFHFCGDKVNPGFPYCVQHCGRAYQAQLPRGVRRPPPPLPFGGPRVR